MQIGPSEGTRDVHICISKFHCQFKKIIINQIVKMVLHVWNESRVNLKPQKPEYSTQL